MAASSRTTLHTGRRTGADGRVFAHNTAYGQADRGGWLRLPAQHCIRSGGPGRMGRRTGAGGCVFPHNAAYGQVDRAGWLRLPAQHCSMGGRTGPGGRVFPHNAAVRPGGPGRVAASSRTTLHAGRCGPGRVAASSRTTLQIWPGGPGRLAALFPHNAAVWPGGPGRMAASSRTTLHMGRWTGLGGCVFPHNAAAVQGRLRWPALVIGHAQTRHVRWGRGSDSRPSAAGCVGPCRFRHPVRSHRRDGQRRSRGRLAFQAQRVADLRHHLALLVLGDTIMLIEVRLAAGRIRGWLARTRLSVRVEQAEVALARNAFHAVLTGRLIPVGAPRSPSRSD